MKNVLDQLADEVREERRLHEEMMRKIWLKPLSERVEAARALSRLTIDSIDQQKRLIHFVSPRDDFAFFTEYQALRLSQNDPTGDFFRVTFHGLTQHGLTVHCSQCGDLAFSNKTGWSLDEDMIDVSHFYLKGIEALANEAHGRDNVFPVLFGEVESGLDQGVYDEVMDSLEQFDSGMDSAQIDAVAEALASDPFHLIQGPPGTGKTFTLARLVEQLAGEGHRVLVTGFTHRSIHNALSKIRQLLDAKFPVVKISRIMPTEDASVSVYENLGKSGLDRHSGAYVIGATPFALFSSRLDTVHFDSAVLDETSQLTLPAAILAMMRSDRWFFFGDHRQLPPVSLLHQTNPAEASVFARLTHQKAPTTMNTTYRLNKPLCLWPSEQFYQGELVSANPGHRLALKQPPQTYRQLLAPDPSLVRMEITSSSAKSRNDEEADHAAEIILSLLDSGIPPEEIGVVTPFRAQASCIRTLLRGVRFSARFPDVWKKIVVDTVDRFQGQEREIILYSFASSDHSFLRKLGDFLYQPARLNVAATRARTKVILLHSPELRKYAEAQSYGNEPAEVFLSLLQAAQVIPCSTR